MIEWSEQHLMIRDAIRKFVETEIKPRREEFEHGIREDVIDGLLGRGAHGVEPVLACIVDAVSEHDRELLDELDRLIKEKRRTLEED